MLPPVRCIPSSLLGMKSEWCIHVEAVLYAFHKKCQWKLCTISGETKSFVIHIPGCALDCGFASEGENGSGSQTPYEKTGDFVQDMLSQEREERGRQPSVYPAGPTDSCVLTGCPNFPRPRSRTANLRQGAAGEYVPFELAEEEQKNRSRPKPAPGTGNLAEAERGVRTVVNA